MTAKASGLRMPAGLCVSPRVPKLLVGPICVTGTRAAGHALYSKRDNPHCNHQQPQCRKRLPSHSIVLRARSRQISHDTAWQVLAMQHTSLCSTRGQVDGCTKLCETFLADSQRRACSNQSYGDCLILASKVLTSLKFHGAPMVCV